MSHTSRSVSVHRGYWHKYWCEGGALYQHDDFDGAIFVATGGEITIRSATAINVFWKDEPVQAGPFESLDAAKVAVMCGAG